MGTKSKQVEVGVRGGGRGDIRVCVLKVGGGGLASQVGTMMLVVLVLVKVWMLVMDLDLVMAEGWV